MVAQAEVGRPTNLAKIKEWLAIASIIVVVAGGILGGMGLLIAPLQTDIRAIHGRLDRMAEETKAVREEIGGVREEIGDVRGEVNSLRQGVSDEFKAVREEIGSVRGEVNSLRQDMNNEFKAVRSDMADVRERLVRVETLLERDTGQPDAPDAQP